jgi:hypothetical protein
MTEMENQESIGIVIEQDEDESPLDIDYQIDRESYYQRARQHLVEPKRADCAPQIE